VLFAPLTLAILARPRDEASEVICVVRDLGASAEVSVALQPLRARRPTEGGVPISQEQLTSLLEERRRRGE
jgi:hypothetical protein